MFKWPHAAAVKNKKHNVTAVSLVFISPIAGYNVWQDPKYSMNVLDFAD